MATLVFAFFLGRSERRRLGLVELREGVLRKPGATAAEPSEPKAEPAMARTAVAVATGGPPATVPADRPYVPESNAADDTTQELITPDGRVNLPNARPELLWFNLAVMVLLVEGTIEPAIIFFVGVAGALILNFRRVTGQRARLEAHASSVVGVVGMVDDTASHFGITPVEMARASLVGLAEVDLGDHHRKTIRRAVVVGLVMLLVGSTAARTSTRPRRCCSPASRA
ncbi:hypothetical protein [Streptomyces sp. AC558_RSS880]|uniref:hypothetical protein n=1 Tax=Streptomyces sp. AC558_RSS880 TaxID=2823687 RepID=UPI001C234E76|nr:hypothetical protein [Streptomyces sp. AC558_RSS880]